ncbi:carboxylate--amine ligase [Mycolicibacterium duvalii]|uniref:Putative glutamate--cysteine ligase 2 n=1 Tax=Mycolicibacterium duvalii TaxID=39688 RepID=A0A7I7K8H6_9MYCO|nr:glutamate--cysteine ligase [Mycolicibacterium duvalii]MCV7366553.1 glutamate--cysteine ligase [Mycolicibacterium duvalii]PEG43672.1 carboxylate--amine ligase [Mycolicibacterium duvalii]BBX20385.1 putative glutamate--cysteine ligase 2-3 [Mycolicibacterium duvalii]
MTTTPTFGVEEEFLLVDPASGAPVPYNRAVADRAADAGVDLQLELTSCQVETTSDVVDNTADLRAELLRLRRVAATAAQQAGAQLLAAALPPTLPRAFPVTDTPRYRDIGERFGMIAHEQGICGCHVHVAVPDREAAIQVSNRLRPWLPLLLALTANSAIYRNSDTGHASWRSVLWGRWPSAGPPPHFDSADEYDAAVALLVRTGAMRDDGMVYWDVRPSANFPTVEVRVADVPATVAETVLFAAVVRGCVLTALDDERRGEPMQPLAPYALKAAYWKAARDGLDGDGVDLENHAAAPMTELLDRLVARIRPALEDVGDYDFVVSGLADVAARGNGATRQRRAWARRHDVGDVLADMATATLEGC